MAFGLGTKMTEKESSWTRSSSVGEWRDGVVWWDEIRLGRYFRCDLSVRNMART